MVSKFPDLSLLFKHMEADSVFETHLSRTGSRNSHSVALVELPDLFRNATKHIITGHALEKYVDAARGNWDSYTPVGSDLNKENSDSEHEEDADEDLVEGRTIDIDEINQRYD